MISKVTHTILWFYIARWIVPRYRSTCMTLIALCIILHKHTSPTSFYYILPWFLCKWGLGYCQLKRCLVRDELTCDFWIDWYWLYKSWAFVLKRSGFQFLIGRTTARVVLRASIQMAAIYSLGLLRCLLRSTILIFRIFIALVLFRFASFSPIVLNREILQEQRHHSVQLI